MYKLRDYQEVCVEKGLEVLTDKKGRREIIAACTASGKALIIAETARRLVNGNVLVLQPSEELLLQGIEKIESFGVNIAVHSASVGRRELGHLIYATPKSISYEALKDAKIKYVIIDECDFGTQGNSELVKLLKQLKIKSCLGLTGSPIYLNQTSEGAEVRIQTTVKGAFFKEICHIVQIQEMVEKKYWSDLQYFDVFKPVDEQYLKLNQSGSDYTEQSTETFYEKAGLKEKISKFLLRLPKGENALVFVPSIKDVDELVELIPNSVGIHSKTCKKLRKQYVTSFKNNTTPIAITALALLTGFDKPDLINIVDASPSNSLRIKIQKDGRGCRIHKDKKFCRIIDFAGNYKRFGDVRDLTIEQVNGYWGIFSGERLLTGVPLNSKEIITKDYLEKFGKPNNNYIFGEHNKGDAIINFGKWKGKNKSVQFLYKTQRHYLKWLAESDMNFTDKELEYQIKSIWDKDFKRPPKPHIATSPIKPLQGQNSKELIESFTKQYNLSNISELF